MMGVYLVEKFLEALSKLASLLFTVSGELFSQ